MDLKHVNTFVMIAQQSSFAKAAELLHLSQPSVTTRIQYLESELGLTLFIRNNRRVTLTKEGEEFLPYALEMLKIQKRSEERLKSISKSMKGKVIIGATAHWSVYVLPKILGNFLLEYPTVQFEVMTGSTAKINEMLILNQIDLGFVLSEVNQTKIKQVVLKEIDLVLVCSPNHPLAKKKVVGFEEFIDQPLITLEQSSDGWKQIKSIYEKKYNALPNIVMSLNQIEAVKEMVVNYLGLAFLPSLSVERELNDERLVKLKVKDFPDITQKMSMIYLENKQSYPLIQLVMDLIKQHFSKGC